MGKYRGRFKRLATFKIHPITRQLLICRNCVLNSYTAVFTINSYNMRHTEYSLYTKGFISPLIHIIEYALTDYIMLFSIFSLNNILCIGVVLGDISLYI